MGIPKNMHAYSRLLFNSKICININICGIHNINEDTCTKKIIKQLHEYALLALLLARFIIQWAA